ncbi:glycosyltransferase [candidate division WWE3 bacterium]|nr:glycosyltransferase [candidate division WWE3 bacterium]
MKILRIIYDWPEPWVGLSPHPYELTVSQAKKGHEITVFAGQWPRSGKMQTPENVTVKGFIREPLKGTLNITTSIALFFYYLKWRKQNTPDVVHAHGHFAIWIYLYRLFLKRFFKKAKELDIPLVAHFHNTVEGRKQKLESTGASIDPISQYLSWPLAKLSDQWAIKAADAYIFVSDELKEEAKKFYGASEEKSFIVESGVNDALFRPVGEEEKEKTRHDLDLDRLDRVIINYGMMVERKNIHELILSLKHLPEKYKLLLVGPGDNEYLEKLNQIIKDNKLTSRIIQAGYTPYPQIPIALQAADIFVLPSSFEGTPKVVMESLSCGVPALVSGFKLSEDIKGLFYLDSTDAETIARQIREVDQQSVYVDRGKVHQLFSWATRAQKVEKVYEFVTKTKS